LIAGTITGLALFASSFISQLWHLYLIYGLLLSLGISGVNLSCNLTTISWFEKRRGLALGIISTGLGLGTSVGIPIITRIINSPLGWRGAYMCMAVFAWIIMLGSAVFLRYPQRTTGVPETKQPVVPDSTPVPVKSRVPLFLVMGVYFLFLFSVQIMMVHMVNYATDLGYSRLTGATLLSVIGILSIFGRLGMGFAADRIGNITTVIICCVVVVIAFLLMIVNHSLVGLYLIAVLFGLGYGGEIPQTAPIAGSFYGFKSTGWLIGMVFGAGCIGGAFGAWTAGYIFDMTQSYLVAFAVAATSSTMAIVLSILLNKQSLKLIKSTKNAVII
jgi:predicted MFS family arabinose efflux permease